MSPFRSFSAGLLITGMALTLPADVFAASANVQISQTPEFTYVIAGRPTDALQVELHNVIHDPVDLTIALLVRCGSPDDLLHRHHVFLAHQQDILDQATPERLKSWENGTITERTVRIAGDLHLFDLAAELGVPKDQALVCLRDETDIKHLTDMTDAALKSGVDATPMFRLNGALQNGIYVWKALRPLVMQAVGQAGGGAGLTGASSAAQPVEMVEYISYTCPHCARFEQESADERDRLLLPAPQPVAAPVVRGNVPVARLCDRPVIAKSVGNPARHHPARHASNHRHLRPLHRRPSSQAADMQEACGLSPRNVPIEDKAMVKP